MLSDFNTSLPTLPDNAECIWQTSTNGLCGLMVKIGAKDYDLAMPYGYTMNHARAGGQVSGVDLRYNVMASHYSPVLKNAS